MDRAKTAENNFLNGLNCTQAIMLAFSDLLELPKETLLSLALPMGGGMGRLRQTCGGVTGAVLCLGLLFPSYSKKEMYELVQEFARRFTQQNGSINCGELLTGAHVALSTSPEPEARTAEYYKKRPCPKLIADAAVILEQLLFERGRI